MKRWLPMVGGLGAFFFWWLVRQWPWPLALLIGIAIGAFLFTVLGTIERLRTLIAEPARVEPSPWDNRKSQDRQQMSPTSEDPAGEK